MSVSNQIKPDTVCLLAGKQYKTWGEAATCLAGLQKAGKSLSLSKTSFSFVIQGEKTNQQLPLDVLCDRLPESGKPGTKRPAEKAEEEKENKDKKQRKGSAAAKEPVAKEPVDKEPAVEEMPKKGKGSVKAAAKDVGADAAPADKKQKKQDGAEKPNAKKQKKEAAKPEPQEDAEAKAEVEAIAVGSGRQVGFTNPS